MRLALLEYLTERGATIAQMVEAHRLGSLPGVAGDLVINKHHDMVPVSEIASESGLALPRVLRALLAAGVPADPDTEVASDLVGLMAAFERGSELMGDEAILAFTRVLGRAATSIAEAAIALFFAEMGPGTVRAGEDELARARQAEAATTAFTLVPEVLARMVTDAFVRAEQRAELARTWPEQTPSGRPPQPCPCPPSPSTTPTVCPSPDRPRWSRWASSTWSAPPPGPRPSICASRAWP